MPVESASDRATFVDTDEFGEAATYTPAGGGAVTVNGIYEGPHDGVELGEGVEVSASLPSFVCRSADLPSGAAHGDTLEVAAGTFAVKDLQPDGSGMTVIELTEQE